MMIKSGDRSNYNIDPKVKHTSILLSGLAQTYSQVFKLARDKEDLVWKYLAFTKELFKVIEKEYSDVAKVIK